MKFIIIFLAILALAWNDHALMPEHPALIVTPKSAACTEAFCGEGFAITPNEQTHMLIDQMQHNATNHFNDPQGGHH